MVTTEVIVVAVVVVVVVVNGVSILLAHVQTIESVVTGQAP